MSILDVNESLTRDLDPEAVRNAAHELLLAVLAALGTYENITSLEFGRGDDRPVREALRKAARSAGVKLDVHESDLRVQRRYTAQPEPGGTLTPVEFKPLYEEQLPA